MRSEPTGQALNALLRVFEARSDGLEGIESPAGLLRAHGSIVGRDASLYEAARAAVSTWAPAESPDGMPGSGTFLVAVTRAVQEAEVAWAPGVFAALDSRFAETARRYATDGEDVSEEAVAAAMSDLDALDSIMRRLVKAVQDWREYIVDRQQDQMMEAFRSAPGLRGRITEQVVGPDGTVHVVRDELVEPDLDLSSSEDSRSGVSTLGEPVSPAERKALGAADDPAAVAALREIRIGELTDMLPGLRLSSRSPWEQVRAAFVKRAVALMDYNATIATALRESPGILRGLLPGDVHALRNSAAYSVIEPLLKAPTGMDLNEEMVLVSLGRLLLESTPYLSPAPDMRGGDVNTKDLDVRLPSRRCYVVHDAVPLPEQPGIDDLPYVTGWIFVGDEQLRPLPGCVCVVGYPAKDDSLPSGFRIVFASTSGPAVRDAAQTVLRMLGSGSWVSAERRRLPGKPGGDKWMAALREQADAELADGSLAQVHRPRDRR